MASKSGLSLMTLATLPKTTFAFSVTTQLPLLKSNLSSIIPLIDADNNNYEKYIKFDSKRFYKMMHSLSKIKEPNTTLREDTIVFNQTLAQFGPAKGTMKTDLENVKKEIQNNKGECSCFVGDITDLKTIQNLFLESKSKLGKLDILINCAGTVDFGSIESFPLNKFEKIMDLNVKSVFSCIQEAIKMMKSDGDEGKIITIGSIASKWTGRGGDGSYSASKYAVYGMIESIARQLHGSGSNIAVGLICPGVVDTTLTNPDKD